MKELFIVLLAITACVMARSDSEFFKHICSVSATGTASVKINETSNSYQARMIRVGDTARYDVLSSGYKLAGSIIMRKDCDQAYFYLASVSKCYSSWAMSLSSYYHHDQEGNLDVYWYEGYHDDDYYQRAAMYFDGDSLVKEYFNIIELNMEVTITYSEVNYNYQHDTIDDAFSLTEEQCADYTRSLTNATRTKTTIVCDPLPLPDNLCSFTATGLADVTQGYYGDSDVMSVRLTRVGRFVRYDIYNDSVYQNLFASYVNRPDLQGAYVYERSGLTCENTNTPYSLDYYVFDDLTDDGREVFFAEYSDSQYLVFDHTTHKLINEGFYIYIDGYNYYFKVNYSSWNYDYVIDKEDKTFCLTYSSCDSELKTGSKYATTSMQCDPPNTFVPTVDCALEFNVRYLSEEENITYIVKAMHKDGNLYYFYMDVDYFGVFLMRCDKKNSVGECYTVTDYSPQYMSSGERCFDEYDLAWEFGMTEVYLGFNYRGEPVGIKCPDGSAGCKKYCNMDYYEEECYIVKDGRVVKLPEGMTVEYKSTVPTVNDFSTVDCDGTVLEAPKVICGATPTSTSTSESVSSSSIVVPSILIFALALLFVLF